MTSRPEDGARRRYNWRSDIRGNPSSGHGAYAESVRVLIFHGYLLLGTGSNVYNAELGAALVAAGHEVHLLSQERSPFALDWVDAAGSWDSGSLVVSSRRASPRATAYRPDIGG